jgi:hypothetical protein
MVVHGKTYIKLQMHDILFLAAEGDKPANINHRMVKAIPPLPLGTSMASLTLINPLI